MATTKNDISVNLRAIGKKDQNIYRILPKTLAVNVETDSSREFVTAEQKKRWDEMGNTASIDTETIDSLFKSEDCQA